MVGNLAPPRLMQSRPSQGSRPLTAGQLHAQLYVAERFAFGRFAKRTAHGLHTACKSQREERGRPRVLSAPATPCTRPAIVGGSESHAPNECVVKVAARTQSSEQGDPCSKTLKAQ